MDAAPPPPTPPLAHVGWQANGAMREEEDEEEEEEGKEGTMPAGEILACSPIPPPPVNAIHPSGGAPFGATPCHSPKGRHASDGDEFSSVSSKTSTASPKKIPSASPKHVNLETMRQFFPGDPGATPAFCDNFLRSSRYKWWNFLPLNLFEQFQQYSNMYFGLNVVVALIPGVSPITPITAILPLAFVLAVGALKEGYEDFQRHRADEKNNSEQVTVLRGSKWEVVKSLEVRVGDIIKMHHGASTLSVKADVIILASSDEDGVVYMETSQLDGESNVKMRRAPRETQLALGGSDDPSEVADKLRKYGYIINADAPSRELYKWMASGTTPMKEGVFNMDADNAIWRSCSIKKTEWCVCTVVYTGKDTKQGQNMEDQPRPQSYLSQKLNISVVVIFAIKNVFLLFLSGMSVWWSGEHTGDWYLEYWTTRDSDAVTFWLNYLTWFILLSFMIPISLFVTIQLCLRVQISLMRWDHAMMHWMPGGGANGNPGWVSCRPKTSDLNEELATVKYIFSDKTGTLTENKMNYVGGAVLGPGGNFIGGAVDEGDDEVTDPRDPLLAPGAPDIDFDGRSFFPSEVNDTTPVSNLRRYLCALALCNTVVPFETHIPGELSYEGTSPDEVALVKAAAQRGLAMTKRTSNSITLTWEGDGNPREVNFEVLAVLDFSPNRKLMSVVLRDPGGDVILITKGADEHEGPGRGVLNRLASGEEANLPGKDLGIAEAELLELWEEAEQQDEAVSDGLEDNARREQVRSLLKNYGRQGWRTLAFGWKRVTAEWVDFWNTAFDHVRSTTQHLAGPHRDDTKRHLEDLAKLALERKLQFGGLITYEDKLQDEVPETVQFFLDAEIVVWMLTGDKLETAIEIAKTCRLATKMENVVQVSVDSSVDAKVEACGELLKVLEDRVANEPEGITLAIDEPSLVVVLDNYLDRFLAVAPQLRSAVCARLTPKMKGTIVSTFLKHQAEPGKTVLAIGDGGNDVTMINTARVGIGVIGVEGRAAELASDYAVPRFRHLKRLLVVHGRYARYRTSMCIGFSFYKNIVLSMCQVYFAFYSAYSAKTIFDSWLLAVKNTIFTGAPPLFMGCFEKDLHEEPLMDPVTGPALYKELRDTNKYANTQSVVMWIGGAVLHSLLVFWVWFPTLREDDLDEGDGRTTGIFAHGTVLMTGVVMAVVAKAAIHIRHHTSLQFGGIVFSYTFYAAFLFAYSAIEKLCISEPCETHYHGIADIVFSSAKFYLYALWIGLGIPTLIDISGMFIQRRHFPTKRDRCQEDTRFPKHTDRPICMCDAGASDDESSNPKRPKWRMRFRKKKSKPAQYEEPPLPAP